MKRRLAALAGCLLLAGCGNSGSSATQQRTVVVFAAASLKESFTTIAHDFEAKHPGVTVKLNFAGSDTLAAEINGGAPVDVFASASPKTMELVTLTHAKRGIGQPKTFTRNQLEIVVPPGNPKHITDLADTAKPGIKLVICAISVPCGAVTQRVYAAARLQARPASLELDVKSVLNKVELGEADAGLVYVSDVKTAGGKVSGVTFPESNNVIATYPIVGINTGKDPADGKAFIAFVLSKDGQDVLTGNGFLPP